MLHWVTALIAISDRDHLLITARSSITLSRDRGKPYIRSLFNLLSKCETLQKNERKTHNSKTINDKIGRLTDLWFYALADTKKAISDTFFAANILVKY